MHVQNACTHTATLIRKYEFKPRSAAQIAPLFLLLVLLLIHRIGAVHRKPHKP